MLKNLRQQKAQSMLEYIFLISLILLTFLAAQKYITRGFVGRWKATGDSFGHARQYDPNTTIKCKFDFVHTNLWYDANCYEASNCDCHSIYADTATCDACITSCQVPQCL